MSHFYFAESVAFLFCPSRQIGWDHTDILSKSYTMGPMASMLFSAEVVFYFSLEHNMIVEVKIVRDDKKIIFREEGIVKELGDLGKLVEEVMNRFRREYPGEGLFDSYSILIGNKPS